MIGGKYESGYMYVLLSSSISATANRVPPLMGSILAMLSPAGGKGIPCVSSWSRMSSGKTGMSGCTKDGADGFGGSGAKTCGDPTEPRQTPSVLALNGLRVLSDASSNWEMVNLSS